MMTIRRAVRMLQVGVLLGALMCAVPAVAQDVEKTITDIEARWSEAMKAKDSAALTAIMAPDWHGQNGEKLRVDRAEAIAVMTSPDMVVHSVRNHDVMVRVFGTVAVAQGADDETSSYKGKDISGTYSWTDVFEQRDGKWVVVASQSTKLGKP